MAWPPTLPLNFPKYVSAQNFFCPTFYQDASVFGTTCMKYVQKHFWREHLCALQVFLCAPVSQLVCTHTCAQLRRNIDPDAWNKVQPIRGTKMMEGSGREGAKNEITKILINDGIKPIGYHA